MNQGKSFSKRQKRRSMLREGLEKDMGDWDWNNDDEIWNDVLWLATGYWNTRTLEKCLLVPTLIKSRPSGVSSQLQDLTTLFRFSPASLLSKTKESRKSKMKTDSKPRPDLEPPPSTGCAPPPFPSLCQRMPMVLTLHRTSRSAEAGLGKLLHKKLLHIFTYQVKANFKSPRTYLTWK